jgi:hypothetical protein
MMYGTVAIDADEDDDGRYNDDDDDDDYYSDEDEYDGGRGRPASTFDIEHKSKSKSPNSPSSLSTAISAAKTAFKPVKRTIKLWARVLGFIILGTTFFSLLFIYTTKPNRASQSEYDTVDTISPTSSPVPSSSAADSVPVVETAEPTPSPESVTPTHRPTKKK